MPLIAHSYIGVDLGFRQDHTALAVVERAETPTGRIDWVTYVPERQTHYNLRHLERLRLGTPYRDAAARVQAVAQRLRLSAPGRPMAVTVVVDATGVGAPVVEMLRDLRLGCRIVPVLITGGQRARLAQDAWYVPKRDLITGLQVMFEQDRLRIAAQLREAPNLARELAGLRLKSTAAGRQRFEAAHERTHDDLVMALALACWRARLDAPGTLGVPNSLGLE